MIRVHAIQTGRVQVKQFQATGARNQLSRMWQLLLTHRWTDWLPVYCWLVEHPAGPFLIDTGEIAKVHEAGHLPASALFKAAVRYEVKREDQVDRQLARLGYTTEQIKAVYLTHFHSDHADGVYHFPQARVLAPQAAYAVAVSPHGARVGYFKMNLPEWFQPETFEFTDGPEGAWASSKKLLADGSLVAVPLPGHAPGHTGYIVKTASQRYVFSGDATFNERTLHDGIPFVILNDAEAQASVGRLREYAESSAAVVLCSHDPNVPMILQAEPARR